MIRIITQACEEARRKFTQGEQSMLIDIYNGTMLTPGLLGQTLSAQVEDSFRLYPGIYEDKWGVEQKEMLEKIRALPRLSAAFLELWAVGFWTINTSEAGQLEDYIAGKINIAAKFEEIIQQLRDACEQLEKTKASFKSATIANARAEIKKAAEFLEMLI